MSRYIVTPADGSAGGTFEWDHSRATVSSGTILEVPDLSTLLFGIGLENLTELAGGPRVAEQTGSGSAATHNA